MCEVDQSSLVVPDVLAMHDDDVAGREWDPLADVDVVVDEQGLAGSLDLHDETLMCTRWPGVVREKSRDRPFCGDLDAREVLGEGALNGRIARDDRAAARRDDGEDNESAESAEPRGSRQVSVRGR
jgi:hypothetical protein